MKKSKLAIGLMTAVLTTGALAGCDNSVKYNADGKIISYKDANGQVTIRTADKLLTEDYYKDSSKFQSIFDAIYSIVVRNYFTIDDKVTLHRPTGDVDIHLGKNQMGQIELDAKRDVESDKKTAQTNADNNGTSYSDEFDAILSSKGVEDEDELKEKYIEEHKKQTFDDNFYNYHVYEMKNGDDSVKYNGDKQLWNGYFNDMVPYHVSHILVKIEDGSGTNYANGTISKDNAKKLYNVVNELADIKNKDSFGTIAKRYSDDTGSAANFGDLGIMDYSTGYVNEFKLGIYAYENFLGPNKEAVLASNINIPGNNASASEVTGIAESFLKESKEAFGADVPEIDFSVFEQLNEYADVDKDTNGKSVIDDSANFYPRNIIYNKELNRHSVAYITTKDDSKLIPDSETAKTTGFRQTETPTGTKNVLSVKTASGWTPILCVRAGSDYQGIHFIVVNRSKFDTQATVSLDNYYTTYYPEQEDYPVDAQGNPLATYINFVSKETGDTKPRAESLLSTIKSYDSERLNKYIFKKYFDMEKIKIDDATLSEILELWISRGFDKKEEDKQDAWEKTWNDYVDTLRKQNDEREKLVSDACRLAYIYGNGLKEDRTQITVGDLIGSLAQAMIDAKEIDPDTGSVFTLEKAKEYIKSIRIGSGVIKPTGSDKDIIKDTDPVSVLFKKEGALCNDGKEHL